MPRIWAAVLPALAYIMIVAVGMVWAYRPDDGTSAIAAMLLRLLAVQLCLIGLCLLTVRRAVQWRDIGFGALRAKEILWLAPSYLTLTIMLADLWPALWAAGADDAMPTVLLILALTTLCIGFSEEVMFRGIVLRGALHAISPVQAMLLSTVLFALMHAASGIAGQSATNTLQQMAFTFLAGFFLAPIALRIGTLWPLILWHSLWNLAVYGGQIWDVTHGIAVTGVLIQAVLALWLWVDIWRRGLPAT
ncbi:CPBP family intramembrane glutamic endopeptidase [Yoonia sp. SS1-5]|uniref:Lysostaphin resistance A-like protein n=1 Tax=Yoonia rhodophyticola TaxID=3137370 RepID=A0AAN0NLL5_9RHOB